MHKVIDDISIEDLKQGSDSLYKRIYEENRDKFLNFARRYKLPEDDIVDIYQDAYIVFYENVMKGKIKSFTSSISTYIISIGKYLIYDKMKKNNRTINPDFDISIIRKDEEVLYDFDIDKNSLTAEQELLQKYFVTLGAKCKELLNLFYFRGFTINEILEQGNYNSENVVKSQKSRCMKTLRERINSNTL